MPFDEAKYAEGKEVLVSVHDVRRTFWRGEEPVHALDGVTLNIYRGEYICVMGPSGSGKSTFFNAVGGLDTPTSGRVFIDGVDMAQLNADELAFLRCRKIGYVFQSYTLGNCYAAQFLEAMEKDLPDLFDRVRQGDFASVKAWNGAHIHWFGATRPTRAILRDATGEDLNADRYVRYLTDKYARVYGL